MDKCTVISNRKGGAGAGLLIWIVGFFLGLLFILTILGAFFGLLIWVVAFFVGLAAMFAGGKTEVIVQQTTHQTASQTATEPVEKTYLECQDCKTKNDEDAEFCKKCGKRLILKNGKVASGVVKIIEKGTSNLSSERVFDNAGKKLAVSIALFILILIVIYVLIQTFSYVGMV